MPVRIIPFVNNYFYHVYNRGSEKRSIFKNQRDYHRFLKTLQYYQIEGPKPKFSHFPSLSSPQLDSSKKIVEIQAYCLMPNHFHLLLRQVKQDGIREFMSKVSNSYTKYFNLKNDRIGPLFQGEFKAVLIENDEQLAHVSRYIHLNPVTSLIVKALNLYPWSSYKEYAQGNTGICTKKEVMSHFQNPQSYKQFVLDQQNHAIELEFIKHQLIDINDI